MTIHTKKRHRPAPAEAPRQLEAFRELDADLFLANQLFRYGRSSQVLAGVTSSSERRARLRKAILEGKLADRAVLDARGKATQETFAAAWARLYREPLQHTTRQGEIAC